MRYEEVAAGEIKHAVRFTMVSSQKAYIHPAVHYASSKTDPNLPPMGLRVRLKASFDISGFAPHPKVVATALKKYGMLMADNGSNWYISGDGDNGWNNDIGGSRTEMDAMLGDLGKIHGSDFEVVKTGTIVK